jgi:hypothetical protein
MAELLCHTAVYLYPSSLRKRKNKMICRPGASPCAAASKMDARFELLGSRSIVETPASVPSW